MISVNEAMQRIDQAMPARPSQPVDIAAAGGKILAQDIKAERDQPPFDRVMMDGIAISYAGYAAGATHFLRQGVQAAGAARQTLHDPTHCIEIMTGAVLPKNCDCIIPIEQIEMTQQRAKLVTDTAVQEAQNIHRAGSDYRRGQVLLASGTKIGGAEMAVLASAGSATVRIALEPKITIIAVGDELIDPGDLLGPAQIRRSNDYAIEALLKQNGLGNNTRGKLPDDPAILRSGIESALQNHDIVVLTGGVSMGKYDYIPSILNELGVEILLHKVSQAPGKPMWVGRRDDRMVFALPGNPVSSLVCARRFVVPAVHTAMGYRAAPESACLSQSLLPKATLTWFVPVTLQCQKSGMLAEPRLTNTSGDFHSLAGTTGFIELSPGRDTVTAGSVAPLWRW